MGGGEQLDTFEQAGFGPKIWDRRLKCYMQPFIVANRKYLKKNVRSEVIDLYDLIKYEKIPLIFIDFIFWPPEVINIWKSKTFRIIYGRKED